MRSRIPDSFCRIAGLLLLLVLPAVGQLQVGDLSTSLSGVISAGYSGDYGNQITSSHSIDVGGSASASGYYYNPNFFSFNFSPYYGQSQANSTYQSITDSSGFNFSSSIFGGSHFPGSVSYAKAYNSVGEYAVPGLPNFTTHGNSDTFGISWAALLPNLPSLTASYQMGSSQYSVYGSNSNGTADFRSFNLNSAYLLAGFQMSASYHTGVSDSLVPQVFQGEQTGTITTDNSGFGANISHSLPLRGQFSLGFFRSDVNTDYFGYSYKGNFDTSVASAVMQPTEKLHVSLSADYTDNLAGVLYQLLIPSGSTLVPANDLQSSHAWALTGAGSYSLAPNLQLIAEADRRDQVYYGENFGATSYSAGVTYGRSLFGGSLNSTFSLIDSMVDNSNQNSLGFSTGVNYNRRIDRWFVGGSFNYAQNVQTLLIAYTTSFYDYSVNVRRRFGKLNWSASASIAHSGLTNEPGALSSSQGYTSSFGYGRWINVTGTYAKSAGIGVATAGGVAPIPLPPLLPNDLITLYGGTSYSFGLSSSPVRRMTLSASYAKASSDTLSAGVGSSNQFEEMNGLAQYQFRKVYLTGGYAHLTQGFSASGLPPARISSFFIGITRWFNFF